MSSMGQNYMSPDARSRDQRTCSTPSKARKGFLRVVEAWSGTNQRYGLVRRPGFDPASLELELPQTLYESSCLSVDQAGPNADWSSQ